MNVKLRLIIARLFFYLISDNTNVSLEVVDCSLYTGRIAPKDDYHKKQMNVLACTSLEFNCSDAAVKDFIITARQNQLIQKNIFNDAQVRWIAIARNQTLHSLDHTLKFPCGFNNLIANKLKNSIEVSPL